MICPHGHDEGMVERQATPDEVDAGCELGIAFDPCPACVEARWVEDHGPAPDGFAWSFLGSIEKMELVPLPGFRLDTLLGVPDDYYDLSACAYYRRGLPGFDPNGGCSFGCRDEPSCITDRPPGGWPGDAALHGAGFPEHPDYDHQAETGQGAPG